MANEQNQYRILFVCSGNICRSPLAQGIFCKLAEERNRSNKFVLDSCGTIAWCAGEAPHAETQEIAEQSGVDISGHRARKISKDDFENFDLLVAMDSENLRYLLNNKGTSKARICRLRDYDPGTLDLEVPDPYYNGDFAGVYEIIERCCRNLLDQLDAS